MKKEVKTYINDLYRETVQMRNNINNAFTVKKIDDKTFKNISKAREQEQELYNKYVFSKTLLKKMESLN